jgi:Serpin (serine protease inhibitor).
MQEVLEEKSGNVVISPISVSVLLSLLQQGSGGDTEAQLTQTLHLDSKQSRLGYSKLTRNLKVKQWHEEMANIFT